MKNLFREIFPKNKESWERYFRWCKYNSYTFYPVSKLLGVYAIIILVITKLLFYGLIILLFPLTRIELKIRSSRAKKQKEKKND
jgi:hypothetical protein